MFTWEDFIRVNEAILAVVERVQRRTRLDGSELAFPPLIQADLLSEVTSTLLKVVEKKTEEHTHKLVSTAIQSSLTLDSIPEKYESLFVLSVPLLQRSISFLLHLWTICVSASKLATDLDWNQVFRPHLLLSPPYKGSPPFTPLPVSCLFSDVPNINPKLKWFLTSHTLLDGKKAFLHPPIFLDSRLTATQVFLFCPSPLFCNGDWRTKCGAGEVDLLKRKQRQAKDKRRKIHTRRKEEKNKRQMVVNQKRRKTKTQLLNQTKWNRIRSVRLPNTLLTPHTTLLVTPTTMSSLHQISMLSGTRIRMNEVGVGKSDERGEKERKKVVVKFMIDSLLSFIRKEMKTRTIKLVTLNPTRIVDNAQSELIVVFFPPSLLDWLGRD
ncbi:hypothetical protein BLNAU_15602 [Blattamonas nauphoetae]|uniref:Uncharacterized protein n=1 Tax=Blattamonas nauphoetae TaxID=2049346 RepID=A0ABQ9XDP1_9EUKA|nr:hypothetical protein BLNAU_15602 [Blattamonas nauphoetae]